MKEFYIGDFYNPEEEKEDWETYVRRKKLEEESQMSVGNAWTHKGEN